MLFRTPRRWPRGCVILSSYKRTVRRLMWRSHFTYLYLGWSIVLVTKWGSMCISYLLQKLCVLWCTLFAPLVANNVTFKVINFVIHPSTFRSGTPLLQSIIYDGSRKMRLANLSSMQLYWSVRFHDIYHLRIIAYVRPSVKMCHPITYLLHFLVEYTNRRCDTHVSKKLHYVLTSYMLWYWYKLRIWSSS